MALSFPFSVLSNATKKVTFPRERDAARIGQIGPDQNVVQSIGVHIARRGHGEAAEVAGIDTFDQHALARRQGGEIEHTVIGLLRR